MCEYSHDLDMLYATKPKTNQGRELFGLLDRALMALNSANQHMGLHNKDKLLIDIGHVQEDCQLLTCGDNGIEVVEHGMPLVTQIWHDMERIKTADDLNKIGKLIHELAHTILVNEKECYE